MDDVINGFRTLISVILVLFLVLLIVRRERLSEHINFFIIAIFFTTAADLIGSFFLIQGWKDNRIVMNIGVLFLSFLFFLIYFYKLLKNKLLKRIQLFVIILFVSVYLISSILNSNFIFTTPSKFAFFEIVLLIISIAFFLYETFNSDRILNIKQYYPFWVCIGLLIVYVGILPIIITGMQENLTINKSTYFTILFSVNIVGYSIMIRGIFIGKSE